MRELLLSFLYDTKTKGLFINKIVSVICAIASLTLIIYQLGFAHEASFLIFLRRSIDLLFGTFALTYFVRVAYSLKPIEFMKGTWIEFLIMCSIIITGINRLFFDIQIMVEIFNFLGFTRYGKLYHVIISSFLFYLILLEFVKLSDILNSIALKPATTFILSFLFLIGIGTGLLMLPELSTQEGSANFMSAFFTSVSASCVTGLSIVDISSYFTTKGQLVIMFLMQLGGIGIVSFTTFFATFMKKGVGIRHQLIIQDFLSTESLYNTKGLLRQVVIITLFIELVATGVIFFSWGNDIHFDSFLRKLYYSAFHAVSAFCNGGFSLFTNSLYEAPIRLSYLLHVTIGITILFGSMGFSAIQDIFSIKKLRLRLEKPWLDWKMSTKISVYSTIGLVCLGMILFILTEYYNTLHNKSSFEILIISFFQSVTTRTAGFNSIDFSQISNATMIFMIVLMFIGASSGSTGGGIKTSTFLLISLSSITTIKGEKKLNFWNRSISTELISKAFSIFLFAASYNLVMIFILSITDYEKNIMSLIFEQISAFSTTGLSTGITSDMSITGQGILILSMFIGRIGTLTLLLALSNKKRAEKYSYPNAHLFIG